MTLLEVDEDLLADEVVFVGPEVIVLREFEPEEGVLVAIVPVLVEVPDLDPLELDDWGREQAGAFWRF